MRKSKYICPYCGAPAEFAQPFNRLVKFLFWYVSVPAPVRYGDCSAFCDDFLKAKVYIRGSSLSEARRNWRKWYEAETAGLPDIPILDYAKYRKDLNRGK